MTRNFKLILLFFSLKQFKVFSLWNLITKENKLPFTGKDGRPFIELPGLYSLVHIGPEYPGSQSHWKLPNVFLHCELSGQLVIAVSSHSSRSARKKHTLTCCSVKQLIPFCLPQIGIHFISSTQPESSNLFITGWTTYNSWLAFWSFKGFYWPKARRKRCTRSLNPIFRCTTPSTGQIWGEVSVGTLYQRIVYQRQLLLISALLMV